MSKTNHSRSSKSSTKRNVIIPEKITKSKVDRPSAKTDEQTEFLESLQKNTLTICEGVAGTGKTMLSVWFAAWALEHRMCSTILLTRPVVEANQEHLGYLPGDSNDKLAVYMMPLMSYLGKWYTEEEIEGMRESKQLLTIPMAYLRGTTFDNTIIVLDEAQNATPEQLHLLLTRVGKNSRIVVVGDETQRDMRRGVSGIADAMERLKDCRSTGIVRLTETSILRSEFVREIVAAYAKKTILDGPIGKDGNSLLLG